MRAYLLAAPIGDHLTDLAIGSKQTLQRVDHLFVEGDDGLLRRMRREKFLRDEHILHLLDDTAPDVARQLIADDVDFAVMPSSGIPGFVDPGHRVVKVCLELRVDLIPIGMSSALDAALAMCGEPIFRFHFMGHYPERWLISPSRLDLNLPIAFFVRGNALSDFMTELEQTVKPKRVLLFRDIRKRGRGAIVQWPADPLPPDDVKDDYVAIALFDRRVPHSGRYAD